MPFVERTQISLEAAQAARLRRLARERGTSMAALIRDAVDRVYPARADDSPEARWARAMQTIGQHRSGLSDVAVEHDAYFAEAIMAHHRERRRR
jgi:hypothetical protein